MRVSSTSAVIKITLDKKTEERTRVSVFGKVDSRQEGSRQAVGKFHTLQFCNDILYLLLYYY